MMQIIKQREHALCTAILKGKLTFNDHAEFRDMLEFTDDKKVEVVILNVAELSFVDSAGLGMMLLALDQAEKLHQRIVIRGATGQVKKMFEVARFNTMFEMD